MYGYLNLVLAALLTEATAPPALVRDALLETDPAVIRADDAVLIWREHRFDLVAIERRRSAFQGFGSCSFREPLDELRLALHP